MIFAFNTMVFTYLFQTSILCIIFAFFGAIYQDKWFILFLLSFLFIPILIYLYREKIELPFINVKYVSPSDGIVKKIIYNGEKIDIYIDSNFLSSYTKRSPIDGTVTSIVKIGDSVILEITSIDKTSIILEIKIKNKFTKGIIMEVNLNDIVKKGDRLCFVEFGSLIKFSIPNNVQLLIAVKSELIAGTMSIANLNNTININNII